MDQLNCFLHFLNQLEKFFIKEKKVKDNQQKKALRIKYFLSFKIIVPNNVWENVTISNKYIKTDHRNYVANNVNTPSIICCKFHVMDVLMVIRQSN